ncbi:MAG: HAD-IC family P-type ATPase, partial [Pseudomonadota bacterium]
AKIAEAIGVERVHANVSPEEKADLVTRLTDQGAKVLMFGDGLNDTGALARAHVSVSPASALDAARAASDIVLLNGDLATLPKAVRLARAAARRTLQNFGIAIAYNCVAVPLALAGLATPLVAAIAMSTSSITVVGNAVRKARP